MTGMKRKGTLLVSALAVMLQAQTAISAPAQVPLFLGGSVEPNILFTLDDSGSMHWELMPSDLISAFYVYPRASGIYGSGDYWYYVPSFDTANNIYGIWARSSAVNRIYYNPALQYLPWAKSDGSLMDSADPTCAPHNPHAPAKGCRNLTVDNTEKAAWRTYDGTMANFPKPSNTDTSIKTYYPAVYYRYDGAPGSIADRDDATKYTKVEIKGGSDYPKGADRADCVSVANKCTYAEEIQNFANWYSYYRSRILLSRAGVGRAFSEQGNGLRVGFASINKGAAAVDGVNSPGALIKGVRKFEGADRTGFFDSLYGHVMPTSGTPLRRAVDDVGKYFSRTDNKGPWGDTPGVDDAGAHVSCRQSYHILMTDGYWNGADAPTAGVKGADDNDGPVISGPDNQSYQYKPVNPFKGATVDQNGNATTSLADAAMYYWNRDLRPNLPNKVSTNPANPAFWQHLVTFTVGLGVNGFLDPETDLPAITDGTKSWPNPTKDGVGTDDLGKIDDLWHAAVNSRGEFFSAADPQEFSDKLSTGLAAIVARTGSSAAIATNSTRLNANTYVYQARFDSKDWRGELLAFKIDEQTGQIIDADAATAGIDPTWEGGSLLDARAKARKIFTHEAADSDGDGDPGLAFTWATLPAAHKALLNMGPAGVDALGEERLDYISGDRTLEMREAGGVFRNRSSIMGDIVNSDPWFVGQQDFGYNLLPGAEGTNYIVYRNSVDYEGRPGMVYVGGNDGVMHGFHAETGEELFAFVPEEVLSELWKLTDPKYTHQFFVDGPVKANDAYINGWKSVLVGATGAGGKSIYALDVSDPVNFSESDVLWEFSSADDADLGYTIGQASVVRMADGSWAAVFGNGYQSANSKAMLFIVDLATGAVKEKISTGIGDAANPNGLATPIAVDINGDRVTDRIYAGDLHGKMWAFDVSSDNSGEWGIPYDDANGNPAPLFSASEAADGSGDPQPITSKPQVGRHPRGDVLVYFGTGKYFENGDSALMTENAFYGIWDNFSGGNAAGTREKVDLLEQVITHETITDANGNSKLSDANGVLTDNPFPWDLRVSTQNSIDWDVHDGWFMTLESPVIGPEGERVVSAPLLLEDRVVFTTLISSQDPCDYGGTSWLMEVSSVDGARLPVTPFDLNGDAVFNADDYIEIEVTDDQGNIVKKKIPTSGRRSKVGIIKTPAVIKTNTKEFKFASGSSGDIEQITESRSHRIGRQSWRQLQ